MKKLIFAILIISLSVGMFVPVSSADEPVFKSSYTIDYNSGYVINGVNEDERYPIASMVKIMTALICLETIENGDLRLDDKITISPEASGMGGSQMFIDTGLEYPVRDLLKGIIVVSANDACVAIAQTISGDEKTFVELMNKKAAQMGLKNTLFANCTGLPSEDEQYSSAKDVAIMLRELSRHELYYDFSGIWIEDYTHPDGRVTQFVNTNKLIRFYKGCVGGKTGFTNEAMFCLAANARRNDMQIISVVIGAASSKERFAYVTGQFNYAFANYRNIKVIDDKIPLEDVVKVVGGKEDEVTVRAEKPYFIFCKKGAKPEVDIKYNLPEKVVAPIVKDGEIGNVEITSLNGKITIPLVACNGVERTDFADSLDKVLELW